MTTIPPVVNDLFKSSFGVDIVDTIKDNGSINVAGVEITWNGNVYTVSSNQFPGESIKVTCNSDGTAKAERNSTSHHHIKKLHGEKRREMEGRIEEIKNGCLTMYKGQQDLKNELLPQAAPSSVSQEAPKAPTQPTEASFTPSVKVKQKRGETKVTAKGVYNGQNGKVVLRKKHGQTRVESALDKTSEIYKKLKAEAEKKI